MLGMGRVDALLELGAVATYAMFFWIRRYKNKGYIAHSLKVSS